MKSTLKHFKNYFSGSLLTKAIAFIYIPIFTRLLPVEDYGILNIFNSYTMLLTVIMTLNTYSALSRYNYEKKEDFEHFYFTNIILTLIIFLLSSIIFLLFQSELAEIVGIKKSVLLLYLPIVIYNVLNSFFNQIYQPKQESRLIVTVNIIYAAISFIFKISVLLLFKRNYVSIILSSVVIDLIFIIFFLLKTWKFIGFRIRLQHIKYILIFCIPLIPYTLSDILLSFFDRIIIGKALGNADAGLYSLAYNIGILFSVFYRSLMITAWMPKYFEYMNNQNFTQHDKDIVSMLRIVSFFGIIMILFSENLGRFIVGDLYIDSLSIIPLVVLGYYFECIHYIFLKNAVYAKKTIYSTIVLFTSAIINIVLNLYFIPLYGYKIAALTTVISYFCMAIIAWFINKYILKMHSIKIIKIIKEIVTITATVVFYYIIRNKINYKINLVISIIYVLLITYCFFGSKLKKYLRVSNE